LLLVRPRGPKEHEFVTPVSERLPALFVGHGSPMNALEHNDYTRAWRALGESLPRPRAILAISAHWYTRGTFVTSNDRPPTIHDFGGFPQPLFEVSYPAAGAPALAGRVAALLAPLNARESADWGLDHGTWSVLAHTYPAADIPIVQLSIDGTQPPAFHLAVGRRLAALRDEGILVFGSGGIVHNLGRLQRDGAAVTPGWAQEFDDWVRERAAAADHEALVDFASRGDAARLSVPTPEHFLPLLYVLGTQQPGDTVSVPVSGFDLGSLSMTSIVVGGRA
jgi:4,5-DOPA dioxygenase extradiol